MIEPFDLVALARTLLAFALPLAALAWTAWVTGSAVLAVARVELDDRRERAAFATVVGLAALAHALLALGLAGALRPLPIAALASAAHGLAIAARAPLALPLPARRTALVGVAVALPLVLPALYPDTGFDSRMYHLPYVHAFARTGHLPFLPDLRFPIFPQASEVLSTALVLLGGDGCASGTGLVAVALAAALIAAWGRRAFPQLPQAGVLAAAIFLGSPLLGYLASTLYVDPLLGLFSTAALLAAARCRADRDPRLAALAGFLAASAADVKYLGLFTVAATALALVLARPPGRVLTAYGVAALATLAPWYGRIVFATGNPVFPFLPGLFGDGPWTPHPAPALTLTARLTNALRMPFDLVVARDRWNHMPPLSPVFVLASPLVVLAATRNRLLAWWSAVIGAFVLVYQWLPKSAAYTAMWLPLASLTVAGSIATLGGRHLPTRPRAALIAAAFALAPGWLYGFYGAARSGPLPVTASARERYLDAKLPLHAAIRWLNERWASDYTVWAVDAEHMTDFARGRFLGDTNGRRTLAEQVATIRTTEELRTYLLGLGVRFVLVPVGAEGSLLRGMPWPGEADVVVGYRDDHATVYALRSDVP